MSNSFLLDIRLALRMLVKYPLLTIVGSIGIAFGIAAGVGGFEMRSQFINPTLPLDEGQRIVGVRNWDTRADRPGLTGETEFRSWLEQLERVEDLSAVALVERNLTVNGDVEPIAVAEMTASGFRVARVPALLGRTLVEGDEAPGVPPVAVIGYDLWHRRFLGDAGVVGRSVRLDVEQVTIVGVMPEGFGFPVLEAQACGVPVLCANSSSLPEVAGKAALLIEPEDTEKMTESIQRLVTDPLLRHELALAGLENVRRFTWEETAVQVLSVLERI